MVLKERLLEMIRTGAGADDDAFEEAAQAVFRHQFEGNVPYRRFCERRRLDPGSVRRWTEIPAVPTDAFKAAALVCGSPEDAQAIFRTSGTTAGSSTRGTHYLPELGLYHAALARSFDAHLLPDGAAPRFLSLVPTAADLPDSSLSHMVSWLLANRAAPESATFISGDFGLDLDGITAALRAAELDQVPVFIPGTAFAFVHWLDAMAAHGERFRLPEGSRLMDTGGFKGRSREVTRRELYAALEERLGLGACWMVNEYGMTEMSSQFYDATAGTGLSDPDGRLHVAPSWVRTRAADPETLEVLPHGEVGVLRHWDLANLGSVCALQTADLGITSAEGFRVLGRAVGAEARGCSLAMDDLLRALGRRHP